MTKNLSPKTLEKAKQIFDELKRSKRDFVKRYGKDAERVMLGRAINMAKNETGENAFKEKVKEIILNVQRGINK